MPVYNDLRPEADFKHQDYALVFPQLTPLEKQRILKNLLHLRAGLERDIPPRKMGKNLLIASWNIKEFGHTRQRLSEAYFYMAEIIARFDLVVIQEIKSSLKDLQILLRLLGPDWKYLVNDITEGSSGNAERSGYLFNHRSVQLGGLAGEIVLWDALTKNTTVKQLKRSPYITGFKAGWKTFAIVNLHLHPGKRSRDIHHRREEIQLLLAALKEKLRKGHLWNKNIILAGDFNLYTGAHKDDATIKLINQAGYREVEGLMGKDTNASKTQAYDRFFMTRNPFFRIEKTPSGTESGGVFNPFQSVYTDQALATYATSMKAQYGGIKNLDLGNNLEKYYINTWRKNQLSDHFPIWFELSIDSADEFLARKLKTFPDSSLAD